ncbi:MAG: UDP-glucose 4-epimerase GalE [Micrococcales bacterium]|nr:UDP-glucose 4-epimerase GalE [Micrococcales bacterium]
MTTVLVTGGAGYIGSHTCVELALAGYDLVVVDNLSNSWPETLDRVGELVGRPIQFHRLDLREHHDLLNLFASRRIDAVVHFAGFKAVGDSVRDPLSYYDNNVAGTVSLLKAMLRNDVARLIFSSSCTVHGLPRSVPVTEGEPRNPVNPYGCTKAMIERIIEDQVAATSGWRALLLRYFNPVGAHPSARIGEDPIGIPTNLMPYVMKVASGKYPYVHVFGDDYRTRDGTGVRDYIHVVDLAKGHVAALHALERVDGCQAINLGTGRGCSVLEVISEASKAVGFPIPYRIEGRRPGDIAEIYADASLAADVLGWQAEHDLTAMCRDHWNWQRKNPDGYRSSIST